MVVYLIPSIFSTDQFQTKADILEEGGIESLVALISNPDPLVLQNTLLVLELLSQDYECRIALNQANVGIIIFSC